MFKMFVCIISERHEGIKNMQLSDWAYKVKFVYHGRQAL